jgi:deferrochelatase/peroxidase EfeB
MDQIQPGVYYRSGESAPPSYRLLLLNVRRGTDPPALKAALESIWSVLNALRDGDVPELRGQPDQHRSSTASQFADLRVLIGFGRRLFDEGAHDQALTGAERPAFLSYLDPHSAFPSIPWATERIAGECDIALQFTASAVAAVNCAAVEVWKSIQDQGLPLESVATHDGFARLDRRGWLEFHDGVSNMDSAVRLEAIEAQDPEWMRGGTFMVFLKINVDLSVWRALGRLDQELAVGRDKLSGAALERVREGEAGELTSEPRRFDPADPDAVGDWRDPPQSADRHLEASHIHRANQSRGSPAAPGALRMFRQGYEFLEDLGEGGPRLGLNFVSFQRDIRVFQHVMNLPGWLGDSNFGGNADGLLTLAAGGFYAIPPVADPFPGAGLFVE